MKALSILLLASVGAWGQTAEPVGVMQNKVPIAPLKCGKYERVEHKMAEMTCLYPEGHPERCPAPRYIDSCAPIMHKVTEKEWQELMERVMKLKHEPKPRTSCVDPDNPMIERWSDGGVTSHMALSEHENDRMNLLPRCTGAGKE